MPIYIAFGHKYNFYYTKLMRVRYEGKKHEKSDVYSFIFTPLDDVSYEAGQFTEIHLQHQNADERGSKRWFTLSSSPTEKQLSISTHINDKNSSFKKALAELEPGIELSIARPEGDFTLPKDSARPLLFVAGGIGITPFRSMIKYLADIKEKRPIKLLYAVRSQDDLAFADLFKSYGATVTTVIGERLTAEKIIKEVAHEDTLIYVSGPEPMVEALDKDLKSAGVSKKNIKTDFFPGYETI